MSEIYNKLMSTIVNLFEFNFHFPDAPRDDGRQLGDAGDQGGAEAEGRGEGG